MTLFLNNIFYRKEKSNQNEFSLFSIGKIPVKLQKMRLIYRRKTPIKKVERKRRKKKIEKTTSNRIVPQSRSFIRFFLFFQKSKKFLTFFKLQ